MTQPAAEPLRVAIAGAGLMGRWHAHAIARAGGRVVGIADTESGAADALAARHGVRSYASLDAMLSAVQADVLHICTPLESHIALARRALEAGLHVLIEKPLAPDGASTECLLAEAQAQGRLVMPVHQFIFQAGVRAARAQAAGIAPLIHLATTAFTAGGDRLDSHGRDQLAADILPHALSLFQEFAPYGVDSLQWSCLHPAPGELQAIAQANGIAFDLRISNAARPTRNEFMVAGARGSIHVDLFHGFAVLQRSKVSRLRKAAQPFTFTAATFGAAGVNLLARTLHSEPAYPGLRTLIQEFYTAIRSGAPAPIAPATTLAIARARDHLLACLGLPNTP